MWSVSSLIGDAQQYEEGEACTPMKADGIELKPETVAETCHEQLDLAKSRSDKRRRSTNAVLFHAFENGSNIPTTTNLYDNIN